jgi:hypothetical protein
MRRQVAAILTGLTTTVLVAATLSIAPQADAEPGTVARFDKGASATRYRGGAFDACAAPPLSTMIAWNASPYRAIGVYIGGPNRTCDQPNLTPSWVGSVTSRQWQLLPIYMGLQAPCSDRVRSVKIDPATAAAQGTASATDAITALTALGMRPGSIVYGDLENYTATDTACKTAVLKYLSGFTKELHRRGYLAGVYANLSSGAKHLAAGYASTAYARPDALWVARWDGSPTLTGLAGISDAQWSVGQRAKQYLGDHDETYGGVTLNIDSDWVDAPVATVIRPYLLVGRTNARTAPTRSSTAVGVLENGTPLSVICQTPGSTVSETKVWNKLANGTYVSDHYVNTPSETGYTTPIPRCYYPFQVTATDGLSKRSGPGSSYTKQGTLPSGSLAWTYCQKPGSKVATTPVWDRINTGSYVTDYYLTTASKTTYSSPLPRC